MVMKSLSSPRRIYVRKEQPVLCYGGLTFTGPRNSTALDVKQDVRIEPAKRRDGKARIVVTQGEVSENWTETTLVYTPRAPKAEAPAVEEQVAPSPESGESLES